MGDKWLSDRQSYLKEHFGSNQILEQSQLKCESSLKSRIKRERERKRWRGKMTRRKKKSKSPKSSLLAVPALLMSEEQKRTKWTTAAIFNYVLTWTHSQVWALKR